MVKYNHSKGKGNETMYKVMEHNYTTEEIRVVNTYDTKEEAKNHYERLILGFDHSDFWIEEVTDTPQISTQQYDDLPF